LALNPLARANSRDGSGRAAEIASHVDVVANAIEMAGVAVKVSNTEGML
jgi:hypothetical protein